MKREHQEAAGGDGGGNWFAAAEQEKGKALMGTDDGVDELLAALGYKVRSSDMADVAQKLEQLEMAMGSNAAANDDALLAHLAFDTVHYNPSDLSNWVDNILLELNAPPPLPQPPPPADSLSRQFDLPPAVADQYTTGAVDPSDGSPCSPADVDELKPQASTASSDWLISQSGHQPEVATSLRDRKRSKVCSSPPSSTTTADAATSAAAQQVVIVDSQEAGIRLVHALMACAEAVQKENLKAAGAIVKRISVLATSQGGAMRKVAGYFAEALARRIYRPQPTRGVGCSSPLESAALDDMLHHHFYESCPYLKFAHFTANQAILEAFAGFRRVHVVDFGMRQGLQWPALLQALALRQGGPPSFRLTGIGPPQPDNSDALQEVGWKLAQLAETIRVDFRYRGFVAASLADLEPYMLLGPEPDGGGAEDDEPEAVAVNSILELHRLLARPGALEKVLGTIRAVRPRIVTVVEQEANHNGRTFLDRFTEALHYYSTMFDSLEGGASPPAAAEVGGHDQAMAEIYLGRQIYNVVACEGAERTERHETLPQWRARMSRAGFDSVPIGSNAFKQASMLLALFAGGEGYRVEENDGCLTLGWHTRPLIATSAWRAAGDPLSTSASFRTASS